MEPMPVFIVGHPRSGSTLLASTLGRHKNLLALPETHFYPLSYAGSFIKRRRAQRDKNTFLNFVLDRNIRMSDLEVDKSDIEQDLRHIPKPLARDVLQAIFNIKLNSSDKCRIVEKTPRHIEYIDRILTDFPKAKVVVILRDGRDAVASQIKAPWTHSNPRRHAALWSWTVREAWRKYRTYPNQVMIVRYEDLLSEPEHVLRKLTGFISEPYDTGCLDTEIDVETTPSWEQDWKSKSIGKLDPNHAYKWKSAHHNAEQTWESWMHPELIKMGYETKFAPPPAAITGVKNVGFDAFYFLWRAYRTHISERKYKFRRSLNQP